MKLYNYRNEITGLFENKNIRSSMHAYNVKSNPEEYDEAQKSEQKFDESIGERVKLRRQKADDKTDETGDEQPDTFYAPDESPRNIMPELESEKSAAQRTNQRGQGLKILTAEQMLSRLPISLAQLHAESNSEKLKNETRQLLYSLYRSKS